MVSYHGTSQSQRIHTATYFINSFNTIRMTVNTIIHFKSASMFGLRIVSNISLAPTDVKCEASLASASGHTTSTNWRHGIWHPRPLFGPSTNSFTTAAVRCFLSFPATRGSQGPNTTIGHAFFTRRGLQHKYQLVQVR